MSPKIPAGTADSTRAAPADDAAAALAATQVLRRLRVVFNTVRSHFQQLETQSGLGATQVWALGLLRQTPAIGMGELARQMDIHPSTASNLVKNLLGKNLVRVDKSTEDRRNVQLRCTPEGLAVLGQVSGPADNLLPQALRQLPTTTLQRMEVDLAALVLLLKGDEQAGGIPLSDL